MQSVCKIQPFPIAGERPVDFSDVRGLEIGEA